MHMLKKFLLSFALIFLISCGMSKPTNQNNILSNDNSEQELDHPLLPTLVPKKQWKQDFDIILTKFELEKSETPGFNKLNLQIAIQNQSLDNWGYIETFFANYSSWIKTEQGFEYDYNYRKTCKLDSYGEKTCYKGIRGGDLKPLYPYLPPGFQVLFYEEEWQISESVGDLEYKIQFPIKTYFGSEKISFDLALGEKFVQPFRNQFVGNKTWKEYKESGLTNVLLLNPGEELSFDSGVILFDKNFILDNSTSTIFLNATLKNLNDGFPISMENPDESGCIIDSETVWGCAGSMGAPETVYVNPGKSEDFKIKFSGSTDDNYIKQITYPICLIVPSLDWRINNTGSSQDLNLIVCEE